MGNQKRPAGDGGHWLALAGGIDGSPRGAAYTSRFAGIGACIPAGRLTADELMASTKYKTGIELERLTGVRERPVAGFTTLSTHSRLCVAFPATIGPGVTMHTKARENRPDVAEDARYAPVKGFLAAVPGRDQRFHVEDHRPDRQLPGRSEQISRPCHAYIAACHRSPRPLHSDVARVEGELIFELRPPLREDAGNGWCSRGSLACMRPVRTSDLCRAPAIGGFLSSVAV